MSDPIAVELFRHQLSSLAGEMGVVLRLTSLSPNIKERADCSAAVFDPSGEMLAQAEHIPVHLGSMPASVQACIERFEPAPGEQYAVNDPFQGGTHLNDLTLVAPVFAGGELIGWVANRAHHADVGGEAPGSMPAHATRLEQEGHVVPPMLAVSSNAWVEEFAVPFLAATRTRDERRGDLAAQIGANAIGAARLLQLVESVSTSDFRHLSGDLFDYGERRMRASLLQLPDGRYEFVDYMEGAKTDVAIRVAVVVDDGTLTADFSGTDPQLAANFNAVRAVTRSCLYFAVRVATDPGIPANGGSYRPIELITEPGSLVDAVYPAAVAAGNVETSQRIADVILGALAPAAPKRIGAASQGTMNNVLIGNDQFAYYETVAGGQGGRPTGPGQSGIQTGMTNTENTPIEALEAHYPFEVTRYTLRRESGGDGVNPGGEGIEREILFREAATLSLMGDRRRNRPWGLNGADPGASGEDWLIRDGDRQRLQGKTTVDVEAGDRLLVLTPGGGGWNPG